MYTQSLIIGLKGAKEELKYINSHFKYLNIKSPFKEGCKFLDIGCGEGHFMKFLESKGIKTKGVDINDVSKYKNLDINFCDIHSIPFEDNSFDLIWSYGIYDPMYSNDSKKIINEALRVLKPQGNYLIKDADMPTNIEKILNSEIVFQMSDYIMLNKK